MPNREIKREPGVNYFEERYQGYHLAAFRQYNTWAVYVNKKLLHGVGFSNPRDALKFLRKRVDDTIKAKSG